MRLDLLSANAEARPLALAFCLLASTIALWSIANLLHLTEQVLVSYPAPICPRIRPRRGLAAAGPCAKQVSKSPLRTWGSVGFGCHAWPARKQQRCQYPASWPAEGKSGHRRVPCRISTAGTLAVQRERCHGPRVTSTINGTLIFAHGARRVLAAHCSRCFFGYCCCGWQCMGAAALFEPRNKRGAARNHNSVHARLIDGRDRLSILLVLLQKIQHLLTHRYLHFTYHQSLRHFATDLLLLPTTASLPSHRNGSVLRCFGRQS